MNTLKTEPYNSFYSEEELKCLGFKYIGKNVKVSKRAIFYEYEKIEIGDYSRIDDLCIISGNVIIGKFVHIAVCSRISGSKAGVILKDFSGVSYNSTIIANSDDYSGEYLTNPCVPMEFKSFISKPVIIEKHALVASHCLIVPGVTIGEGTAIGAMSLVLKNTDDWSIYMGTPAVRKKARKENIKELEIKFLAQLALNKSI